MQKVRIGKLYGIGKLSAEGKGRKADRKVEWSIPKVHTVAVYE